MPKKYGIVTIRGPRRSGKTTIIKLLIQDLIENHHIEPDRIYYVSLDYSGIKNIRLFQILEVIARQEQDEKYVFLDEVSMYDNWALDLKNAFDTGMIFNGKLKIIATGSHSMDLAEATEKLRDRQGPLANEFNLGGNLLFTPLRFPEIVEGIRGDIRVILDKGKQRRVKLRFEMLRNLSEGIISNELQELHDNFFVTLSEIFKNYLIHGGYPKAIKRFYEIKSIDKNFYFDIADLLIKDSNKAGLDPETLNKILAELVIPNKLSGILDESKLMEIKRDIKKQEIQRYLRYLTSTWTFFLSYRERKDNTCEPNYQERPKLYILDPFIFHALYAYTNNIPDPFENSIEFIEKPDFCGLLTESIIASHLVLSQQLFAHVSHINYDKVLMYNIRENNISHEIDFILCINREDKRHRFIIESKYREKFKTEHIPPSTIVLTKDKLYLDDKRKITYIPVPLFLMLF
jgi:predicted AAA+ superfamily ATPase